MGVSQSLIKIKTVVLRSSLPASRVQQVHGGNAHLGSASSSVSKAAAWGMSDFGKTNPTWQWFEKQISLFHLFQHKCCNMYHTVFFVDLWVNSKTCLAGPF